MNQPKGRTNKNKNDEYSQSLDHFEQWWEYLKQSLQFTSRYSEIKYENSSNNQIESLNLMDTSNIGLMINEMDKKIPQWFNLLQDTNLDKEKLLKYIVTGNELRVRLIRVKLPSLIGQIQQLFQDYNDLINQTNERLLLEEDKVKNSINNIQSNTPLNTVLNYLSGINEVRKDEVVQLCRLADANNRLHSTNLTDVSSLESWIEEIKGKFQKSSAYLENLEQRKSSLEGLLSSSPSSSSSNQTENSTSMDVTSSSTSTLSSTIVSPIISTPSTLISNSNSFLTTSFPNNINSSQLSNSSNESSLSSNTDQNTNCLSRLQNEFESKSSELKILLEREREAKRAWEEAQAALTAANGSLSSIKTALESILARQQIMQEITQKRVELEKYNIETARITIQIFEELKNYVQNLQEKVSQGGAKKDIPLMFSQIIQSFCVKWLKLSPNDAFSRSSASSFASSSSSTKSNVVEFTGQNEGIKGVQGMNVIMSDTILQESDLDPRNDVNQLSSLARIGLEMTRLWKQLNAIDSDEMWISIMQFEAIIHTRILSVVKNPSPLDRDTKHIPRYSDTTVVLYYDHLNHLTPKNHFENPMRTAVTLKALTEQQSKVFYYSTDFRVDEETDSKKTQKSRARKLELLSCNNVVSPPLWALPLTHSPSYLQKLCRLAGKAHELNAIIPLDLSCEYEYIDNETNQNVSDDQSESEEKIPVRNKQDGEFVLGNEVDGILKDKKGELLSLLKADQDDLLVLRALKKSNGNNNNNSKSRNQTQAPSKFPTSSNNNLNQNDTEFITVKQEERLSDSKYNYFKPQYVQELIDFVSAWQNGNTKSSDIDHRLQEIIGYLVHLVGSQKIVAKVLNISQSALSTWLGNRASISVSTTVSNSSRRLLLENSIESLIQKFKPNPKSRNSKSIATIDILSNSDSNEIEIINKDSPTDQLDDMDITSESFVETIPPTPVTPTTPTPLPNPSSFDSLPPVENLIERKSTPNDEYYMYTLTNPNGYKGVTSKRPPRATKESEVLRGIVQSLYQRENLSDDDVARELSEKLEPTKTVTVANWRSYRSSAPGDAKMNFCMILWIQDRRHQLLPNENTALLEIEALIEKHSQLGLKQVNDDTSAELKTEILNENLQLDQQGESELGTEKDNFKLNDHTDENDQQQKQQEKSEKNEQHHQQDDNDIDIDNDNYENDQDNDLDQDPQSPDNHDSSLQSNTTGFLPLATLRLHVIEELARRAITQTAASEEANLNIIGLGQPAISLLLHKTEVKPGKRGSTFRRLMQDWLNNSRLLPSEVKDESKTDTQPKEILVESLVTQVKAEIKRRKIFQSRVITEAALDKHGYGTTAFTNFMTDKLPAPDQLFKTLLKDWLETSSKQPTEEEPQNTIMNDEDFENISPEELNFDALMPLSRLHTLVLKEMHKRGIKQKDILFEANVDKSSLSNFITGNKCANSIKGYQFRKKIEQWLKQSQESHDYEGAFDDEASSGEEEAPTEIVLMETSSLKQSVTDEIIRRGLTRNQILEEAGLSNQGFKQLLSQVLVHGNCVSSQRGLHFREKLELWLKESLLKSQSSVVLFNNQEKIYHLRLSLIYEFKKEELSNEDAFREMKFENPLIDFEFFTNYLNSIDFDHVKSLFPTVELTNDFIQGIRNWIDQKYEINGTYDANGDDMEGSTGDVSPKKPSKRKRVTLPESFLNLDDESDNEVDSKKTKVPTEDSLGLLLNINLSNSLTLDNKQSKENEKKNKSSGSDTFLGKPLIRADPFREDFHYLKCEACGQKVQSTAELVNCVSCPYGYHSNCITPSVPLTTKDWSCIHCRESGIFDAQILTSSNMENLKQSPWVLVWSAYHKKWRPGCVLEIHNETGYLLIRWWRNDSKWGRSNWLDISEGKMLWKLTGIEPLVKARLPVERKSLESNTSAQITSIVEEGVREQNQSNSNKKQAVLSEPRTLANYEMSTFDTFISADSLKSAICAAGSACRAVDIVMCGTNTNVFCCMRPPGHHVGRRGFTDKCAGTGFCLLNNAAIAMLYARVRWGLKRVAVVDIDVHFGNGTSEILKGDPRAFFGCVHMIHGETNEGFEGNELKCCTGPTPKDSLGERFQHGFFPHALGCTQVSENYISVGIYPESAKSIHSISSTTSSSETPLSSTPSRPLRYGSSGFRSALVDIIIPQMERFDPELLIISAGFDGNKTDPLGGDLGLSASDYGWATHTLLSAISKPYASGRGRVISLMEGGYDIRKETQGLVFSVDEHVKALRKHPAAV